MIVAVLPKPGKISGGQKGGGGNGLNVSETDEYSC